MVNKFSDYFFYVIYRAEPFALISWELSIRDILHAATSALYIYII